MAQLEARIGSDVAPTLRRSRVTLGMSTSQQELSFWFEESNLFVLDVSRVGDVLGFTATIGEQVDVYDTEQTPDELLFSGLAIRRKKPFIQQIQPPYQVEITVLDWTWRMAHPPTHLSKAYQSPTQTEADIISDALEQMELDDLGYTYQISPSGNVVPPIVFENANMAEVADQIAELMGLRWRVTAGKVIVMKPEAFFPVAPFRVGETEN